jgi:hypothetical protein
MQRKLVLWFVLLIVGFLAGFILQYDRLQQAQQELSASTKQLGSCQAGEQLSQLRDKATVMFLEAVQKNYGKPGRTRKSSSIKLSEFRAAREIPHFATCFVTHWQSACGALSCSWLCCLPFPPCWNVCLLPRADAGFLSVLTVAP